MKSKTKLKSDRPILIRFDWAMKRLLRQKSNYAVLEGLLSALLNEEVKIISLKESESNQENPASKFNRVDIFDDNWDTEQWTSGLFSADGLSTQRLSFQKNHVQKRLNMKKSTHIVFQK